eukprot:g553.t1
MLILRHIDFLVANPIVGRCVYRGNWAFQRHQWLSLTPEFKTRFYFPLERLDQILDGKYSKNLGWTAKWKAYLEQFHKLRIDQIKGMLTVCAKRRAMPRDLLQKLQTSYWTSKLAEGTGAELASILYSLAILTSSKQSRRVILRSDRFVQNVLKQAMQRQDLADFQPIALSQCLYAFALLELQGHPLVDLYSTEVAKPERSRQFSPQSMSNILWSWAKLDHFNLTHVEFVSTEFVKQMNSANEQNLANVIWSWGILQYRHRQHWMKLIHEMKQRKERLTGQGLSTLFVACGRVAFRDNQSFSELLKYVIQTKKVVLFNSQVLSNILWALGKVQYPVNDPNLLSFIHQATKASRLEEYIEQELCCLALGLQGLNFQEVDSVRSLQEEIMKSRKLSQFSPQELCTLILEIIRRKSAFDEFSNRSLINVVVGWAHCQFTNKEDSNVVFREVMKNYRLQNYSPQELSNLTWAFGKLKIHSGNLYSRLNGVILLEKNLGSFSSQSLSNILLGWAHGRFHNHQAILTIGTQFIKRKDSLIELKDQEIANVCWSLGKMKFQDQQLTRLIAMEAVKTHRVKLYTPQQLSNILLGWANSAMRDFNLWDHLVREFTKRDDTLVLDMPVYHNITTAMKNAGFNGLNDYRNRREKGIIN